MTINELSTQDSDYSINARRLVEEIESQAAAYDIPALHLARYIVSLHNHDQTVADVAAQYCAMVTRQILIGGETNEK
jgi:Mg-chelatase subunit ChlI